MQCKTIQALMKKIWQSNNKRIVLYEQCESRAEKEGTACKTALIKTDMSLNSSRKYFLTYYLVIIF